MTMTLTLREVQHLSMEAWPYKRECRGHDSTKKESVALMRLALLAIVHLHFVQDSVQYIGHERDMKKQTTKHKLLLE